jgi:Zn-dependent alcohol dehydrogenase
MRERAFHPEAEKPPFDRLVYQYNFENINTAFPEKGSGKPIKRIIHIRAA